ncbi:TolC family protein [Brumimicrobium oceani]|uniref:hypothetical protein n=1 Tax=Brumimicrobium oceani TaxID=2100725 RepID=UPI0011B1D4E4|nr:hypothetical protein [Brumimicrobium oceani]
MFSTFTHAQITPENEVRKIIEKATVVISPYLDTVPQLQTGGNSTAAFSLMNRTVFKRSSSSQFLSEYNLQKSEVLKKDWGVDLNANYIENINVPSENVIDNSIYNRRAQIGVEWDILKNGLVENRKEAQYFANKAYLDDKYLMEEEKDRYFLDRWNHIIFLFNQEKLKLLSVREGLINEQIDFARSLFFLKHLSKEELLKYESTLAEIKGLKNLYNSYNDQYFYDVDSTVFINELPLYDINYEALVNSFNSPIADTIKMILEEQLALRTHWSKNFSVNTFARYNTYDLAGVSATKRNFFTFGLGLSMPLPVNIKAKNKLEEIQQKIEYSKYTDESYIREKNILNLTYEYRYKLKQYIQLYQKRRVYEERVRKLRILKNGQSMAFNPIKANQTINELLSIDLELIDLKQNLYLNLLKIYSELPYADSLDFVKNANIPNYADTYNNVSKGIYVWTDAIRNYSGYFLEEYAELYNLNTLVIVQPKNDTLQEERYNWIPKSDSIRLEIMVGNNQLIFHDNPNEYIDLVLSNIGKRKINALHLDVEPHVFDDWQEKKVEYLQQYLVMLKKVRVYCDQQGIELTVSIPLHYIEEYTMQIFEISDKVYFMAYENIKIDYIARKITPFLEDYKSKVVIALRTNDFTNRIALEEHIQLLKNASTVSNFVIHDMESLIELDKKTLLNEEY